MTPGKAQIFGLVRAVWKNKHLEGDRGGRADERVFGRLGVGQDILYSPTTRRVAGWVNVESDT
jgi:hypothetical protein